MGAEIDNRAVINFQRVALPPWATTASAPFS